MQDMVGLVFIDWLRLTAGQWVAVGLHTAGWIWCVLAARRWHPDRRLRHAMLAAGLLLSGLWVAFWNDTTCVDERLLFDQAREISPLPWSEFVEALVHQLYLDYQPPFFTYWIARMPVLWRHQLIFFPWAMLCAGLMWTLYGRNAALLLATPVFAFMIHQPSNDVLLFGALLIVLRLWQLSCLEEKHPPASFDFAQDRPLKGGIPTPGSSQADSGLTGKKTSPPRKRRWRRICGYRLLAAVIYGLTWMIKPLTILTVPFILPHLGIAGLLSLSMWTGYVSWSLQWEFGRYQLSFLLQQVMIGSMKTSKGGKMPRVPLTLSATLRKLFRRFRGSLGWRWTHLGHKAVHALPFYLFPAYLRPWTWRGIALAVVIILGYGQIKYLLLDLLFLFPVCDEKDRELVGL